MVKFFFLPTKNWTFGGLPPQLRQNFSKIKKLDGFEQLLPRSIRNRGCFFKIKSRNSSFFEV